MLPADRSARASGLAAGRRSSRWRCSRSMRRPAPRSVALEDDALFVLSSYFLGVEHPPGYPLFTLIGHLFT